MGKHNAYSSVAGGIIERVRDIAEDFAEARLPDEARDALLSELECHRESLERAFEFRKSHGPERGMADSDVYFSEKLGGLISFARMAVDHRERGNYGADKIVDNVSHYSYLVAKLVAANWNSRSKRPVTDLTIRSASFANRAALARLVDR